MSYFRPLGDGPVTSPSQVDDPQADPGNGGVVVGVIPPTRVECATLPADSPWRAAGQVCAGAPAPGILDALKNLLGGAATGGAAGAPSADPAVAAADTVPPVLLLGGLALAAYYLLRGKKPRA